MATTVLLTDSSLADEQRRSNREPMALPGRLVWKDNRDATRFASVTIRNLSAHGAYVECESDAAIPLYRLVFLQAEANGVEVPSPLGRGRVLAAVFRVDGGGSNSTAPTGFGLRLLVEPEPSAAARTRRLHASVGNVVEMPRPLA